VQSAKSVVLEDDATVALLSDGEMHAVCLPAAHKHRDLMGSASGKPAVVSGSQPFPGTLSAQLVSRGFFDSPAH
jgi:hypothetical protein